MDVNIILLLVAVIYVSYKIGVRNGENTKFGFASVTIDYENKEKFEYSFESGNTFKETVEKIENLAKENAILNWKYNLLKAKMSILPEEVVEKYKEQ